MLDLWTSHLAWRLLPIPEAQRYFDRRRNQAQRAKARDKGLCSSCLKRECVPGMKTCEHCQQVTARGYQRTRAERGDAGLCIRCAMPREMPERLHCQACIDRVIEARGDMAPGA